MSHRALGAQFHREHFRETMRLGIHAQQLRAEAVALGYKTETKGFYGASNVPQNEHAERRLTLAQGDQEHAAYRSYAAEQAELHVPMGPEEHAEISEKLKRNGW